jgi:hypothetical protein
LIVEPAYARTYMDPAYPGRIVYIRWHEEGHAAIIERTDIGVARLVQSTDQLDILATAADLITWRDRRGLLKDAPTVVTLTQENKPSDGT